MRTIPALSSPIRRWSSRISSLLIALIILAFTPLQLWAAETCFAVADEGDQLVTLHKSTGAPTQVGATGVAEIEAMAFKNNSPDLYAANGGEWGTLNILGGAFTPIGQLGTLASNNGPIPVNDVDSLSWDPIGQVFYGALRRVVPAGSGLPDETEPDLLIQIDATTGKVITGAFGGADYVPISVTSKREADIDDISFHPILSNTLYGMANDGGKAGTLVKIDQLTGGIIEIGAVISDTFIFSPTLGVTTLVTVVIDDIEGLSFFNDGQLYGSTGNDGPDPADENRLFKIDPNTGKATLIGEFPKQYADYEALACLTAQIADDDEDGVFNIGEDVNGNGDLTDDDTDGDGIPNFTDDDDDNDTIKTIKEDANVDGSVVNDDTDGDKTPNYLDVDDDGDGTETKDELGPDLSKPLDSDNDGVADYLESFNLNTDKDLLKDQFDDDDDGDGVKTIEENPDKLHGPLNDDTDLDGVANFLDSDDDGDGIPTKNEYRTGVSDDVDEDLILNYLDTDSDGDGLLDSYEWSEGASDLLRSCSAVDDICKSNDVDGDDIPNFLDPDSDGDGRTDKFEYPLGDTDGDGIPDWLDKFDSGSGTGDGRVIFMPFINR